MVDIDTIDSCVLKCHSREYSPYDIDERCHRRRLILIEAGASEDEALVLALTCESLKSLIERLKV